MLHIVNYTHKEVNLGNGVKIAPLPSLSLPPILAM